MGIFDIANARANRITRYFRRNEGTTDYASIPGVTLAGDFEIRLSLHPDLSSNVFRVFGNSSGFNSRLTILTDGSINFRTESGSGAELTSSAGAVDSNKFSVIKITSVSNIVTILVNGVGVASGNAGAGNMIIDQLYRQGSNNESQGVLSDFSIIDAGTLVRNYPINESSGTTIFDEVSGQNGTIIDGSNDDRGLFQEVARGGNWQGSGLTVPPWASVSQILVVA